MPHVLASAGVLKLCVLQHGIHPLRIVFFKYFMLFQIERHVLCRCPVLYKKYLRSFNLRLVFQYAEGLQLKQLFLQFIQRNLCYAGK